MSWKPWITPIVLLLAAGGLWFALKEESEPEEEGILFEVAEEEVVRVEIVRRTADGGTETLRFERKGDAETPASGFAIGRWRMVAPFEGDADGTRIDSVLRKTKTLSWTWPEGEEPEGGSRGFDSPAAVVTIEDKAGKAYRLEVGDEVLAGERYGRADGRLLMVGSMLLDEILPDRAPLADFRDRNVVRFHTHAVESVGLWYPDRTVRLAREGEGWRVAEPGNLLADAGKVESFLSALRGLRVDRFADDAPSDLAPYGLVTPSLVAELGLDEGGIVRVTLGAEDEARSDVGSRRYFFRVGDGGPVYTARIADRGKLVLQPVDLRAGTLFPGLDPERTVRIRIAPRGGTAVVLERAEGEDAEGWRFVSPDVPVRDADATRTATFVHRFRDAAVQGVEIAPSDRDRRRAGLREPAATIEFSMRDEESPHRVAIGEVRDDRLAVAVDGEEAILRVDPELAVTAGWGYLDLRNRELLTLWSRGGVRLEVERDGTTHAFEKSEEDGRWILPGDASRADQPVARDINERLAILTAERFVAYGPDVRWSRHGLDPPRIVVRATFRRAAGEDPSEEIVLHVGERNEIGQAHARFPGDDHLFLLPLPLSNRLYSDDLAGGSGGGE